MPIEQELNRVVFDACYVGGIANARITGTKD